MTIIIMQGINNDSITLRSRLESIRLRTLPAIFRALGNLTICIVRDTKR